MIPENYALERVDVSALSAFAGNPRTHSDGQIDQIAASIREFGWTNPILVDADGTIIAGHGRLEAAKRLQLREVPVIRLGHLSEAQRKALVIADNQLALNAGWDEVALSNLIRDLDAEDFELDVLGFMAQDLERYLAGIDADTAAEADEGSIPEVPVEPVSKPGDLWILGNHRLLCGDATVLSDVERLMDGQLADMVFSDPPYNVDYGNGTKGNAPSNRSASLCAPTLPRPRARRAAVQPAFRRSADVTARTPTSRRPSAIRPAAAMASGTTAP